MAGGIPGNRYTALALENIEKATRGSLSEAARLLLLGYEATTPGELIIMVYASSPGLTL